LVPASVVNADSLAMWRYDAAASFEVVEPS
jgi:hypothetical protein